MAISKLLRSIFYAILVLVLTAIAWAAVTRYRINRFQGRTAQQWLEIMRTDSGPSKDILKPKQVITGEEPTVITFEVPINSSLLGDHPESNRVSRLALIVDGQLVSGTFGETNGNARLYWNVGDEGLGRSQHQIQVQMLVGGEGGRRLLEIRGPSISFVFSAMSRSSKSKH